MHRSIVILFLVLCCAALRASAQVSIIMYPLPQQQLKPADMFSADVLNAGSAGELYFIGTITRNGQKVVSAKTKVITINQGSTRLNETLLSPEYTFFSSTVEQTGSLPYGNYNVCLKAYVLNGVEETAIACEDLELMPLSPPLLLSPENQSSITEEYPLLVWLPPMPVGKEKVLYDLKLVEMMPNQTAYDAIQKNFATLEERNIASTTLQYPANAIKLEAGKKYAWKVSAYTSDRKPIGETEVWWFTRSIAESVSVEKVATTNYIQMKKEVGSDYTFISREVRAIFNKEYEVKGIKFFVNTLDQKQVAEIKPEDITYTGDNKYVIELSEYGKIKRDGFYVLEARYEDGKESQYLVFKYISK